MNSFREGGRGSTVASGCEDVEGCEVEFHVGGCTFE
jgi:hypothetical protein